MTAHRERCPGGGRRHEPGRWLSDETGRYRVAYCGAPECAPAAHSALDELMRRLPHAGSAQVVIADEGDE